ncbi:nitroreductase/quinone reductase family protein [Ilumatobacter sp.]|uniref:nitroreductase/quinone reductase family protein n=1 Tax=Ilumatobacter sp. TaxID=1967498 RepID=UPI003AF4C348
MTSNSDTPASGFLPPRWFIRAAWKTHKALYRWSGGRFGLRTPRPDRYGLAYLTTVGRRSGVDRSVMIGYFEDGDGIVTMAMNGWGAPEPAWWLNLQAQPEATLDLAGGTTVPVVGRRAEGEERDRLWERWRELDDGLDGYAARRPTETAVVVLDPRTD